MQATMTREDYERRLNQHPALKVLRSREPRPSGKTSEKGVPSLIAIAIQDEETAGAFAAFRRVRDYEAKVDTVARRRLMGEGISRAEEEVLVKKGKEAEDDYRSSLATLARKARLSPDRKAYEEAARDIPVPDEILDDIPSSMTPDEQEAMTYVGFGPEHPVWKEVAEKRRTREAKTPLAPDHATELLANIEKGAAKIDYSLSSRHLREKGILTIGGNDIVQDLILLIIFLFFFLPWLIEQLLQAIEPWIVTEIRHQLGWNLA